MKGFVEKGAAYEAGLDACMYVQAFFLHYKEIREHLEDLQLDGDSVWLYTGAYFVIFLSLQFFHCGVNVVSLFHYLYVLLDLKIEYQML